MSNMAFPPRTSSWWASMTRDRKTSRSSVPRTIAGALVFIFVVYLLWLPILYIHESFQRRFFRHSVPFILEPGADPLKHFAGSDDCRITQADIYLAPWPTSPQVSPFCSTRAGLLEALSSGGRHGFDKPYVGKGCTYRWYPTQEICMILERFNTIVFIGDEIAQSIYAAFNVLLREDLLLGGLQQWTMSDQERLDCKCDSQFNRGCQLHAIKSMDEVKRNGAGGRNMSPYSCQRIPHAYISVDSVPASITAQTLFKDMTYSRLNPWQPSPMIVSFGHSTKFDVATTTKALDEWYALAVGAERHVPMLSLGPPASNPNNVAGKAEHSFVKQYENEMAQIAKEKHYDVLGLYNLTVQASFADGDHLGERDALVQAMMVINWLSKLETS